MRSSFRRKRLSEEERRRKRAEEQAELDAVRKSGKVRDLASHRATLPKVVLVDGYNAIFSSASARKALNDLAEAFGEANQSFVYVMYDAMYGRLPGEERRNNTEAIGRYAVAVYSAFSEADSLIARRAQQWKKQGAEEIMVVSNDRYVQDQALDEDFVIYARDNAGWLQEAFQARGAAHGGNEAGSALGAVLGGDFKARLRSMKQKVQQLGDKGDGPAGRP
ncbi:hypothetical protein GPECTOR_18g84 [Gonium pectorale]|uniref:NYN domain-containing protein n=1 Tax=Gonium pectorale TaxID=33097 RepID=A0A150GJV7_GONPE|nr:hypothetical protein GPECTOR_18g84 [Gonium pectorale]|eukprot:KXZ50109.1 hypothetical protein GPECTOR_18g84 [Gonium pectorale]